jgi:hypothetical protein
MVVFILLEMQTRRDPPLVAAAALAQDLPLPLLPHLQTVFQNGVPRPDRHPLLVHPLLHSGRNCGSWRTPIPAHPAQHLRPLRGLAHEPDHSPSADRNAVHGSDIPKRRCGGHR